MLANVSQKLAKEGQMKAAKTNAKMLVRNRNQVKKMYEMKANLIGVRTNIMNMKSTHAMTAAMKVSFMLFALSF